MKAANVENKVVDEANERAYIVMARRLLTAEKFSGSSVGRF